MNNPSEDEMINSIIGLGEKSIRKSYYPQLKAKLAEIEELNKSLEQKVQERTEKLETTIDDLKRTQEKLIESEKMASLGEIVAGVSKEINKPVDIAVTSITYLLHTIEDTMEKRSNHSLDEEDLELFLDTAHNMSEMIHTNLISIAKLVRYFQRVKVAKEEINLRKFNLKEYIHGIILNIEEKYPDNPLEVKLEFEDALEVCTSAEDFSTIITILLINSIKHAFTKDKTGQVIIQICLEDGLFHLQYKDIGRGMKENVVSKIFHPFFTTSEDENDYGLGLSIIYNIITNKLDGQISCQSQENKGTTFDITIPLKQEEKLNYYI